MEKPKKAVLAAMVMEDKTIVRGVSVGFDARGRLQAQVDDLTPEEWQRAEKWWARMSAAHRRRTLH